MAAILKRFAFKSSPMLNAMLLGLLIMVVVYLHHAFQWRTYKSWYDCDSLCRMAGVGWVKLYNTGSPWNQFIDCNHAAATNEMLTPISGVEHRAPSVSELDARYYKDLLFKGEMEVGG